MSSSIRSGFSRTVTLATWLLSLTAACAVATEPEPSDDNPTAGKSSSAGSSAAGTPAIGGTSSAFGGTQSTAGASSSAGTSSMGGMSSTAGSTSAGGKAGSGSAGKGGSSSAGSSSGGSGGSGGMTMTHAGSGGSSGTGCTGLKTWKGGDSTLTIAEGEVVQWMGKRYKANAAIAYPNTECAPDKPVDWCKDWFTPDGDC